MVLVQCNQLFMPIIQTIKSLPPILHRAWRVTKQAGDVIRKNPSILLYPLAAAWVISVSFAAVNGILLNIADRLSNDAVFAADHHTANLLLGFGAAISGYIYLNIVLAFFTCAASAAVIAGIEDHPAPFLHSLASVAKYWRRIIHFGALTIIYIPLTVLAQHQKLSGQVRDSMELTGSALSMSTAQLAPVIMTDNSSAMESIKTAVNTLGKAWRENLVIKSGMYVAFLIVGAIGFLPKIVEHYWFNSSSASYVGWFVSAVLWLSSFIIIKVLGGVFTTTLYYHAKNEG